MSYLLDKKTKQKKFGKIAIVVVILLILFYFQSGIFSGLSYVSHGFFRPIFTMGRNVGEKFQGTGAYFSFKKSLLRENEELKLKLAEQETRMADYNFLLAENESLKEIFLRKDEKTKMILSTILAKPSQSPYDTLLIDAGENQGVKVGAMVFAFGDMPVGRVAEVFPNSTKVILFSNAGERTQVSVTEKNIFMELVGRGGGNFEMILPREITLEKGEQVFLPGVHSYVVAVVEDIISDPRDPFIKALLVAPANIQEIKFVQIAE